MNYLITGASKGIGYDTAMTLAKNPSHTILVISRNHEGLQQLINEAQKQTNHKNIHSKVFDIVNGDFNDLQSWVQSFGALNGIVNNAGILINKSFENLSKDDWTQTFATNLFGVVNLIQQLLPILEQAHIINIGSMGGYQGSSKFPGLSAYSASKAALANLTECLAEEFKDRNITVNCLALGAVQTAMLEGAFPAYQAPVSSLQMGEWVAWFLKNGQTFFNGKVIPVSVSTP